MQLEFLILCFFVESMPVNDDSVMQESDVTSKRIKLKVRERRDQCPEDEMTFCEGEFCGQWICIEGTKEHDSCELEFSDDAAGRKITEKYRTCSCHSFVGPLKIFVGCKWKSSEIRQANLKIANKPAYFETQEEVLTTDEKNDTTKTIDHVKNQAEKRQILEQENFMLFDFEETEKTSDISQIFTGPFLTCLRALPGQADIICRLEESTRPCEIKCGDETDHNVCLCDEDGCFWRNLFNRKCNSFEGAVHHEETIRERETISHEESALSNSQDIKNDEGKYKTILKEDGTYVHGFDLILGLMQEMYDNGLLQK